MGLMESQLKYAHTTYWLQVVEVQGITENAVTQTKRPAVASNLQQENFERTLPNSKKGKKNPNFCEFCPAEQRKQALSVAHQHCQLFDEKEWQAKQDTSEASIDTTE